ncbi:MAG: nucleotide sugar dehydrogenase [Rhodospirillaceae bacterium]|nr:nucleotide sugar dehydrogenase [Rhodospirillaceae bacterium]
MADGKADALDELRRRLEAGTARVGVIGLGYVGVPLACAFVGQGIATTGFDIDSKKIEQIESGENYLHSVDMAPLNTGLADGRFQATTDFALLAACDAILICVPTPLTPQREPDLSYVDATARAIAASLRPGQLVVLESTTYPGTTREVVRPILDATGLTSGADYLLAYSPEREDPGNPIHSVARIPKVIGGEGQAARDAAMALYRPIVPDLVPVSSTDTAEAVKLTENIFRAVNIALVNELKLIYGRMGIDVWEVIDAAKTKPFGYMPFYPGPGLGGHCIPIDPFYLTWRARSFDAATRFVELAGEINTAMPYHVVDRLADALGRLAQRSLYGSRILILGAAYKKNVADVRESPALKIMEILSERGALWDFHDPHVAALPRTRRHPELNGRAGVALDAEALARCQAVLICTDHDQVDYAMVARHAPIVVDTRNALAGRGLSGPAKVVAA